MSRVFLDENVDPKLKPLLAEFTLSSVHDEGWNSVKNRELLRLIESRLDVLISHDRGMEFQQEWPRLDLALIVLRTKSNRLSTYHLIRLIRDCKPGSVQKLEIP